jgi:hypothetical protein
MMSGEDKELKSYFNELVVVTQSLLALDLDSDEGIERLIDLQRKQVELRTSIDACSQMKKSNELNTIINNCFYLEGKLQEKLSFNLDKLENEMGKLKTAAKVKNSYQPIYYQSSGYFIDEHE